MKKLCAETKSETEIYPKSVSETYYYATNYATIFTLVQYLLYPLPSWTPISIKYDNTILLSPQSVVINETLCVVYVADI